MSYKRLVLLETSGNQAYVFATNKLRDVVGASELIRRVGEDLVKAASNIVKESTTGIVQATATATALTVEPVLQTSGKALLLFDEANKESTDNSRELVGAWSQGVLLQAPGLDASGVISNFCVDMNAPHESDNSLHKAVEDVHRRFETARTVRRAPQARFQRLPFVEKCAFSSYPASIEETLQDKTGKKSTYSLSYPVAAKWKARETAKKNLEKLHEGLGVHVDPDDMEEKCEWWAVVHADGNGLGSLFLNFEKCAGATGKEYKQAYGEFSKGLDEICRYAYREAVREVFKPAKKDEEPELCIIPVVVAGDDLTVIMDGEKALDFTRTFMEVYTDLTDGSTELPEDAPELTQRVRDRCKAAKEAKLLPKPRLGMAAGICIVKPHYPFHTAYDMAEELMRNAKKVKGKVSVSSCALDFHIVYDSSVTSVGSVREQLRREGCVLTAKPYCLSEADGNAWAKRHSFKRFENAVTALKATDQDGKRMFPSSQAHDVRTDLFGEDRKTQEAFWSGQRTQYREFATEWAKAGGEELYFDGAAGDEYRTVFLDALEALRFTTIGGKE
jgi:hypothetical protein